MTSAFRTSATDRSSRPTTSVRKCADAPCGAGLGQLNSVDRDVPVTAREREAISLKTCFTALAVVCCLLLLPGCSAFRPMSGVPARYIPEELKGLSRENGQTIDLSLLRRTEPAEYLVDSGDVLAVYIENILGQRELPPINTPLDDTRPLTLGYPLTVRDDGTLSLPLIQPIGVRGKSIPEIEQEVRYAYTIGRRLLRPGQDRIVITLQRPRQHRILVVRQEMQSDILTGISTAGGAIGNAKKGTGQVVSLDNYKNDVLNALVKSGGLPGLDAQNVVYVLRTRKSPPRPRRNFTPPQPAPQQFGPPNQYGAPDYSSSNMAPLVNPYGADMFGAQPGFVPQQPGFAPGAGPVPQYPPVIDSSQLMNPQVTPPATSPTDDLTRRYGPIRGQSPDPGVQQVQYMMMTPRQLLEQVTGVPMPPRTPTPTNVDSPITRAQYQDSPYPNGSPLSAAPPAGAGPPPPDAGVSAYGYAGGGPSSLASPSNSYNNQLPPGEAQNFVPQQFNNPPPQYGTPPQQFGPPQQQFGPPQQTGPPQYGSPQPFGTPQQFGPTPQSAPPANWQPPAMWNNVNEIASGAMCNGSNVVRIPLRLQDCEPLNITERDVILHDGDILFIASRDDEVFYTGGLLGGGEYNLPRDRDLDILEAIAIAESAQRSQQSGRSALNSDVSISPSQAIILRKLPNNTQVPILVDLYRAREYPTERLRIQPGDYIILQYTRTEAVGAFIERHILESALFGVAASQFNAN
jgi:protein involved in polysaccharide export with SLBB domain